jgi:hypothetical protein
MDARVRIIPPFGVRMPSELKIWVEKKSAEEDRSQNYVIVKIIRQEMEREKGREPLTA